ncbi:MAG: hypothetical protein AVO33_09680 [delta proteobacterium ML8_F1]|nr:MAG: hypothetical protein AVO33_09680 [delta proteobacterium ML8_F1]
MKLPLKENLLAGRVAIGTFVTNPSPDLIEIIALGGFDFVVVDTEHGDLAIHQTKDLVRAAELHGMGVITRVTENNAPLITRALDVGAHGVQIPQVNTVEDARRALKGAKYFPLGERGIAMPRSAEYGNKDPMAYFEEANRETLVSIHIENLIGYHNLEDIIQLEGIDVVFLGPFDMSQSLGTPGDMGNPRLQEISQGIVALCRQYGKIPGTFVSSREDALKRINEGYRFIGLHVFDTFILKASQKEVSQLRNVLE